MTLRIEKAADRHKAIIRLSGRLQSEHLDELKMQVDGEQSPIALDLEGVTLVDIEVVRFLNACEKSGVELLHCWPYIREWMIRENAREGRNQRRKKGEHSMTTITTKDGTQIYYKDWGRGQPITFSHGWPLNSDAWDGQMLFLVQNGYRCVAVDRRGHGRSSQPSTGNNMDGYADDLAAVIEALDLKNAILIGHSTGGGEVARYVGRHGSKRVAKAVLLAAVPPIMLKTKDNPEGLSMDVFDRIRAGVANDRSQYYKDLALQFYGANRPGAKVSQGILDQFWLWSMQAGALNAYESVKAFSETDFSEDLKKFDFPTLVLHGEDDQIVPVKDSAKKAAKLIKGAKEIYYPGAPHGLTATHQDQVNAELLKFIRD